MSSLPPPEWIISSGLTDYAAALADMEARAGAIHAGEGSERIWLLEHPPVYTAGTSANNDHICIEFLVSTKRAGINM